MSGFRICVYGPEVVNLLGFAGQFPGPIILDLEGKATTNALHARTLEQATKVLDLVRADPLGQTLIVNGLGSLEQAIWDHVCQDAEVEDIELAYGGYQKGVNRATKLLRSFLSGVRELQDATGLDVVLLGCARVRKDRIGGLELGYWKPDMRSDDAWTELRAFCQATLFADLEGHLRCRKAKDFSFVASNYWGLPDSVELDADALLHEISECVAPDVVPDVAAAPPPVSPGTGGVGGSPPAPVPHAYRAPLARAEAKKREPVGQGAGAISPSDSPVGALGNDLDSTARGLPVAGEGPAQAHPPYPVEPAGRKREHVEARLVAHGHDAEELRALKWRELQALEGRERHHAKAADFRDAYRSDRGETIDEEDSRLAEEAFGGEQAEPAGAPHSLPPLPEAGPIPCPVPACIHAEGHGGLHFDGSERSWAIGDPISALAGAGLLDLSAEDDGW